MVLALFVAPFVGIVAIVRWFAVDAKAFGEPTRNGVFGQDGDAAPATWPKRHNAHFGSECAASAEQMATTGSNGLTLDA